MKILSQILPGKKIDNNRNDVYDIIRKTEDTAFAVGDPCALRRGIMETMKKSL